MACARVSLLGVGYRRRGRSGAVPPGPRTSPSAWPVSAQRVVSSPRGMSLHLCNVTGRLARTRCAPSEQCVDVTDDCLPVPATDRNPARTRRNVAVTVNAPAEPVMAEVYVGCWCPSSGAECRVRTARTTGKESLHGNQTTDEAPRARCRRSCWRSGGGPPCEEGPSDEQAPAEEYQQEEGASRAALGGSSGRDRAPRAVARLGRVDRRRVRPAKAKILGS